MKSKEEIEKRKLEIYDDREKFSNLCKLEEKPTKELLKAFDVVNLIYTEKISELDWVLSDSDASEVQRSEIEN